MKRNLLLSALLMLVLLAAPVRGYAQNSLGGWEILEDTTVTEEAAQALENAASELLGADYEPVALLASQLVSGSNYCILCRITPVTPEAVPEYALVYVYSDLTGKSRILEISDLEIGISDAPAEPQEIAEDETAAGEPTMGEKNALGKADDYFRLMAFSYSGLVDQLVFEGFSKEEAIYAADHCGADWKEQAAKKAESYLALLSFSRSGLIDQLKFDGFTAEEAEYAADKVGY